MYAIIQDSGAQRKVTKDEVVTIDLFKKGEAKKGEALTFDKILVVGEAGGGAKLGTPFVAGASVTAEVIEPVVQGEKLFIHKFAEKKGYKRKTGHRQSFTRVKITGIKG